MENFDPQKVAELIERYLGPRLGRWMIRLTIFAGLLGLIGAGFYWFFAKLVKELLWPFFIDLFGAANTGISLDNIEAIIITLVTAIVVLVVIFSLVAIGIWRAMRRRVVPQSVIDGIAVLRSEGISILNDLTLPSVATLPKADQDAAVADWKVKWTDWASRVTAALEKDFTTAEKLQFDRLGVFPGRNFWYAVNPEHSGYLEQLAHQLRILEYLIHRHLERL